MKIRKSVSSHGNMTTATGTASSSSSSAAATGANSSGGATGGQDSNNLQDEKPSTSNSNRRGSSGAASHVLSGFGILKKKSISAAPARPSCSSNANSSPKNSSDNEDTGGVKRGSFTQHQNDTSDTITTSKALHINLEDNPNMIVYQKMEAILTRMQKDETGVPIKNVKSVWNKIPSVFTGQDLITWLLSNMDITDPTEALMLANRMAAAGYYFPIDDHVLAVKNDNTYYRFQTPYYWPSKNWSPENTDYAVYLCKRTMQNKARLELADYEAENLARLQKMFTRKWEYIFMQAESQSKVDKKRDKQERKILDTQERAFWDVYRPPPGCVNTTELDIKKVCKFQNSPSTTVDADNLRDVALLKRRLRDEANNLKTRVDKRAIKVGKCTETYIEFFNLHHEYDAFLVPPEPPNPWITDSTELWDMYAVCARDQVAERRVRRWSFSCWDMLKDPIGHDHFKAYLEKEYATENLLFVEAVWKMKKLAAKDVAEECRRIWRLFLGPGAEMLVNVDAKSHKTTKQNMETPDRWTFDVAAAHLYYLMSSDSYSRYLRSQHYKDFLDGAKTNKPRTFAIPKISGAKINNIVSSATNTKTVRQ